MCEAKKILVVDDDRDIVRGLSLRLRAAGYEVLNASNGQIGLEMAGKTQPDAILLDIRMPVMDGLTMLSHLRQSSETSSIPTIVLSANIAQQARAQAMQLGSRYFLEKPFDAATVIRAIQSALNVEAGAEQTS